MKNVITALVTTVATAGALAGTEPGYVQLRLVPPASNSQGSLIDFEDGTIGIDVLVQTTILDDPSATGLTAGEIGFADNDPDSSFAWAPLTAREAGAPLDGLDPLGRAGTFPKFRTLFGEDNENLANGTDANPTVDNRESEWSFQPLIPALPPIETPRLNGAYEDVYKLRWSTPNRSPRTVLIDSFGSFAGYFSDNPDGRFVQPVRINGSPRIRIVFSSNTNDEITAEFLPGLDTLDGNTDDDPSVVDIRDMLVFVERWLNGNVAADVNSDGAIDVVDILEYVDCWLNETGGL